MSKWWATLALAACTPTSAKFGLVAGGGAVVGGVVIAATASGDTEAGPPPNAWGALLAITGFVILIPCYLTLYRNTPPDQQSPMSSVDTAQRDRRERAWKLTQRAAAAAREDHCELVVALSADVLAIDADFHATVFSRDAAIARCLNATHAPAP